MSTFLAALQPVMRGLSRLTIHAETTDAGLRLTLIPSLANVNPDSTDAALAPLISALSKPVLLSIPADADADAYAFTALTALAEARTPAIDAADDYRATLAEAASAAKAAAAEKAKSVKPASSRNADRPSSPSKGSGAAASADDKSGTDSKPAAKPAPDTAALALSLFDATPAEAAAPAAAETEA